MRLFQILVVMLWSLTALAAGEVEQILDEPEVNIVGDTADIRINFVVPVTYLRYFPEGPNDTLRIAFDITDPCLAEKINIQESKSSPKGGASTPFTLTFPEVLATSKKGNAVCSATRNRVETNKTLLVRFANITPYKIVLGGDNHSIIIRVPVVREAEAVFIQPKLTVAIPSEGASAKELMHSGKAAMNAGEYESAVQIFNRLLNLPPNDDSQEAQELVGNAREKNGDFAKAKIEYELYLKLYPESEGALRVKLRLAAINEGKATVAENKVSTKKQINQVDQKSVFGSLSQYYYGGRTLTNERVGNVSTKTRNTDQSALVTSFDATARWRHNQYDDKFVFRNAQTHNFPPGDNFRDANRLSAAYWEHEDKSLGYMTRLGRQPGNSQGVLGRFDGGFVRYDFSDKFKITGVAGVPDDGPHSPINTNRQFYGAALEFANSGGSFSGNVYGIQQNADGMAERRALGTELRYFKDSLSGFGLLDYDTIYNRVNIALLQGNYTAGNGITYNMLLDHRKSPVLYAETAVPSILGVSSVGSLQKILSKRDIVRAVNRLTATTDTAMFGATKQLTPKWQLGGDIRLNRTSRTKGVDFSAITPSAQPMSPTPASGTAYTYSLQAVGTNIVFADDTAVINGSYINDPHYDAEILGLTSVATFRSKWHVTSSLNLYHEDRDNRMTTIKYAPTVRVSYQMFDAALLEAELGFEQSHEDDKANDTKRKTLREFMFVGYRWDF